MYYSNEKIKRGESQKSRVPTLETFEAQAFDPGVAKFGIALEWGSRGPEFESQHSDQNKRTSAKQMSFYFGFRHSKGGSTLRAFKARDSRTAPLPRFSPAVKTLVQRTRAAAQKGRLSVLLQRSRPSKISILTAPSI